jgi:bis(5'-nucleosyl)-tetraphosphatase (symmetrical)
LSTYVIGDVQGCHDELQHLIDKIAFDPATDKLWFVGDLVNRGRGSLETLRFVKSLGSSAVSVLGNHDIHLLALYCGVRPAGQDPTLDPVLQAEDVEPLLHWLLHRPLLHRDGTQLMVHAGLHRDWSIATACELANEIESALTSACSEDDTSIDREELRSVIKQLYGRTSGTWADNAATDQRLRYALNCLTRMRFCTDDGTPDFSCSDPPGSQPAPLLPWYELQNSEQRRHQLFIGHWSALGLRTIDNLCALDSGCVWGNSLSAMRLADGETFSIACSAYAR